jgi:probable biosynthetic protein (TIGR04099 family)
LTRLSRNRFLSQHCLSTLGAEATLKVELLSALLKRERARDNTSLCEGGLRLSGSEERANIDSSDAELLTLDKAIRSQRRDADGDAGSSDQTFRYRYRPLPQADFNGAGLLYFANYHSMVDRAEWEWRPAVEALAWSTARRETFFFANLNPGDQVEVVLHDLHATTDVLCHRAKLLRVSDGRLMAEVYTIKQRSLL